MTVQKEIKERRAHYSGNLSRGFWKQVNSLPDHQQAQAYMLGVILQNVEGDVLRILANLTREVSNTRRRKGKGNDASAVGHLGEPR